MLAITDDSVELGSFRINAQKEKRKKKGKEEDIELAVWFFSRELFLSSLLQFMYFNQ